jgi:hypothetical protein
MPLPHRWISAELELGTLRWFRDGRDAAGFDDLAVRYSRKERDNAIIELERLGLGSVERDVDYEGEEYIAGAMLTPTGAERLEALEGRTIVRRRRAGWLSDKLRIAKDLQWIATFLGGAVTWPALKQIWRAIRAVF